MVAILLTAFLRRVARHGCGNPRRYVPGRWPGHCGYEATVMYQVAQGIKSKPPIYLGTLFLYYLTSIKVAGPCLLAIVLDPGYYGRGLASEDPGTYLYKMMSCETHKLQGYFLPEPDLKDPGADTRLGDLLVRNGGSGEGQDSRNHRLQPKIP